jgi:hypothetical protein
LLDKPSFLLGQATVEEGSFEAKETLVDLSLEVLGH